MLQHISWNQYWTTAGTIIIVYYLLVMLIYYKQEIKQFIRRNKHIAHDPAEQENQVQ